MILLLATMILLIGSVAATDTASNDTTHSSISTASSLQTTTASSEASDTDTVSEKITTPSTSDTSSTVSDENTVKTNSVTSTQSSSTVKNTTSVSSSDTNSNTQTKSLKSSNSSSSKTSTKMSVTNTTLYGYSNYTMKATVVDNSSKYVNSGTVAFKINGVTVGNTTVSNGKASYVYPLNGFSAGTYNITAIYSGTTKYSSASAAGTLNINKYDTKTTVTSVTGKSGSSVTLKAVITTSNGSYVKNGLVAFKINGNTVGYANVSNGGAKLDYIIPSTYGSTLYTVTAVYGGNNIYSSSKNNGNLTLTPTVESKITIKTTPVLAGKTTTIKAIITTNNGSYIKSGIVAFKINGKTIGYGTVSNGGGSITYTIPSSYKDSTYTITAVYGGNGKYIASRANSTLTVLHKQTTSITVNTVTVKPGSTATFSAVIKSSNGSYVKNGTVAFKINGKTIGSTNVTNGVAKINYTIPSSWGSSSYTITVVYGDNEYYSSSRANGTLKLNITSNNSSNSKISVPSGYESYVKSTSNCDITNSKIVSLANTILSKVSSSNTKTIASYIFSYVNSITSYTYYSNTRYGAVGTLTRGSGNCCDLAHLVVAVMRACNIPARYCHATCTFRSGLVVGHVWAQVYVNGVWYNCDASSSSNTFGNIVNWSKCGTIKYYTSLPF